MTVDPSGFVAVFAGDDRHMVDYLASEVLAGESPEVRRPVSAPEPRAVPVVALTEREAAVLRLLTSSLSLREVGSALYVSLNTVKTHARGVYRKLGASSREGAVARARELGLL